ncbi:hypothetical protein [Deinococcus sp. QL22]|uniref:hypothetical protein n=1 Tax=Deinococcus sp. QL22 TaxID=2939437 RepID=UPI0020179D38|nr:hypothetical protein [Deinococcus sp. QL22]UQN07305.1 hypothetical protein M1R55_05220 [Deinococcus sp. QL22]
MKAARPLLPFLLTSLVAVVAHAATTQGSTPLPAGWQAKLASLLPQAGQATQILERRSSLSLFELQRRVTNVGGSPDALRTVIVTVSQGKAPAYDARLGITQDEFKRYLVFQQSLAPSGKSLKLPVTRDNGRLTFGDTAGMNGVLRGVSIDLKTGELRVREGFSARPNAVTPSSSSADRLDVKLGYQWNLRANDPVTQNGIRGQFTLLLLNSGQIILSYDRFSMFKGSLNEGELILGYTR